LYKRQKSYAVNAHHQFFAHKQPHFAPVYPLGKKSFPPFSCQPYAVASTSTG
jgi:hypothetical protein